MQEQTIDEKFIRTALWTFVSILFAGNVYFVRNLVDKLDATENLVFTLRQQIAVLSVVVEDLKSRCRGESHGRGVHEGKMRQSF